MLVIGSRGSKLALWQANHVKHLLAALGEDCRIEVIRTTGDAVQHAPLKEIGNKGLFTKEIEDALIAGSIDVAVHSLKDMPSAEPGGLTIAATPEREDPRDVMIGKRLDQIAPGGRVGTGSLRRIAQLTAERPDLVIESIRGNVDTRLRKLEEGRFDAIVLAAAGMRRLGWESRIAEYLSTARVCPAVGQGALAIQTRDDRGPAHELCRQLDHAPTRAAITAERAALECLGGGCQVPVGVHAAQRDGLLYVQAIVISIDGKRAVRREIAGPADNAREIGATLGRDLLDSGVSEILESVQG